MYDSPYSRDLHKKVRLIINFVKRFSVERGYAFFSVEINQILAGGVLMVRIAVFWVYTEVQQCPDHFGGS